MIAFIVWFAEVADQIRISLGFVCAAELVLVIVVGVTTAGDIASGKGTIKPIVTSILVLMFTLGMASIIPSQNGVYKIAAAMGQDKGRVDVNGNIYPVKGEK